MPDLGAPEIIIIAVVVLILFGSKKLPEAARSVGKSLRIFKAETKGLREEPTSPPPATQQLPPAPAVPGAPTVPTAPTPDREPSSLG